MAQRQNYIVRNGVAQPFPIPDAPRPTISEMRQLLRGYDQVGTLIPNSAILVNENSWVDVIRVGTLYADNIAGIVAETWTNPEPVYITIGGVEQGDVLEGMSAIEILQMMLYPYLTVAFTSFSMQYPSSLYEIGQNTITTVFPTWVLENETNIIPNSIYFTFSSSNGTSGVLATGISETASGATPITHTAFTSGTVGATTTFTISASQQQDVDATASQTISWRSKIYVGKNTNSDYSTLSNFSDLSFGSSAFITSNTSPAASGLSLSEGAGYVYIFIHSSLNNITSIAIGATDQTPAFQLVSSSHSMTNTYGNTTTYKVYRSSFVLNGSFILNIT